MDEQESAKINYANFVRRMVKLNEDYKMLIDAIRDLREKMFDLCDQKQEECKKTNQSQAAAAAVTPHAQNDKQQQEQQHGLTHEFNETSSFHQDYQFIQNYFDLTSDKCELQQFIKDIAKDFWKLYLKFSLQDGNRVNLLIKQAKSLSYPEYDDVMANRLILQQYFQESNDIPKQQQQQQQQQQQMQQQQQQQQQQSQSQSNNPINKQLTNPSMQQIN